MVWGDLSRSGPLLNDLYPELSCNRVSRSLDHPAASRLPSRCRICIASDGPEPILNYDNGTNCQDEWSRVTASARAFRHRRRRRSSLVVGRMQPAGARGGSANRPDQPRPPCSGCRTNAFSRSMEPSLSSLSFSRPRTGNGGRKAWRRMRHCLRCSSWRCPAAARMARSVRACCAAGRSKARRPVFELVTGVSTGALTAPFAYLGSSYDPQLRTVYTDLTPSRVLLKRGLTAALFNDALADNSPLFKTISRYLDEAMLAALAKGLSRMDACSLSEPPTSTPSNRCSGISARSPTVDTRAHWKRSAGSCSPPPPYPAPSRRPCST